VPLILGEGGSSGFSSGFTSGLVVASSSSAFTLDKAWSIC
jgi:hypothetical protein